MKKTYDLPVLNALFASLAVGLLSGCSANFAPNPLQSDQTPIGTIKGSVHGGQAPVTGAHIYLYTASVGGYGTAATSLISSTALNAFPDSNGNYYVVTDANGDFALSGDYTCRQGTQVYAVAVGGNPGLSTANGPVNNTAIVQMAGLGQCPAADNLAAQVPYLVIDEVTTVAFAYAMGGFATNAYNVSSSGTVGAQVGIANAMANANNIASIGFSANGWGAALTQAAGNTNSVAPQQKLNTLANIVATCVNSSSATSTGCTSLFQYATPSSGTQPTDEATALFNIVHNPTANVGSIFNLQPSTPVFSPYLSAAPTDWTMPIVYKAVVGTPVNIALDSSGNAWISDSKNGAVVKIGPQGAVSTFTSTNKGNQPFKAVYGVAVAPNGTIWVADFGRSYVYIMDSTGTVTTGINNGNLDGPAAIAFDQSGNAFVVNESGVSISTFDSSGNATAKQGYAMGQMNHPNWIAVDTTEDAWIASQTNYVGELQYNSSTGVYQSTAYALEPNYGLAFDGTGNLWVAGYSSNELDKVSSAGVKLGSVKGSGLNGPQSVAIDGAGNIWMGNTKAAIISGFSNASVALYSAGLTTGTTTGNALFVAPDSAGNLWSANSDGTVSQILGAATPVITPILPGSYGTRP